MWRTINSGHRSSPKLPVTKEGSLMRVTFEILKLSTNQIHKTEYIPKLTQIWRPTLYIPITLSTYFTLCTFVLNFKIKNVTDS